MKLVLVPCGLSSWLELGRLLGRLDLPADPDAARLSAWAARLRSAGVTRILHSPDNLARGVGKSLASTLGVPTRAVAALAAVDMGLWTGLTAEQVRTRFATAHRQLLEAPLSVTPPGGEALSAAAERIGAAVQRIVRRSSRENVALVLRPLALALARYALEPGNEARIWEDAWLDQPLLINVDAPSAMATAAPPAERRAGS
jgi:broad specificity phosphatase PhoE